MPERTGRTASCHSFSTAADAHTRQIAEGLAQTLLDISGEAPYPGLRQPAPQRP